MPERMQQNDHDLLIVVHTKLDELILKVDKLTDDHEKRIRSLEKFRWILAGGLIILQFLTPYVVKLFK